MKKRPQKEKKRSPILVIIVLITLAIIAWMTYNFVIALQTGEPFSFFGNGKEKTEFENFVVAGVDEEGYRTDLILFCQLNKRDGKLNILQIPRDTKVENKRNDKKINSAYFSGMDVLQNEIHSVTGLKANHYAVITFEGFKDIIDAIGGVEVDVPIRMKYDDPVQDLVIDLQPGVQKLNGEKAEMFMRFRKNNDGGGYPTGDLGRMEAQKQLYNAIADKLLSPATIFKAPGLLHAVNKNSETDFTWSEMVGMMGSCLKLRKNDMQIIALPGEGKYIGGVSYFVADKTKTKSVIAENFILEEPETISKKAEKKEQKTKDGLKIRLIDASGGSSDKTVEVRDKLEEKGFDIVDTVKWEEVRESSSIIEYEEGAGEVLKKVYKNIPVTHNEKKDPDTDLTFIIGKNFK